MISEHLVGYSVRSDVADNDWTDERRQRFLIRPEIDLPKSVDSSVWEDVVPNFVDAVGGFKVPLTCWTDREAMSRAASQSGKPGVESAISIWCAPEDLPDWIELTLSPTSTPISGEFDRIGFDVADGSMLSGLSNCALNPDELREMRIRFGADVNDDGLFNSFDPAVSFKVACDELIPEHAPFFVYGLYVKRRSVK
jgi:hypothetical protein